MYEVSGFPVQPAKVQRPPLRDDVLARDRLLDWLHAKINHRLILILAEAGYGKTTLLTDFAGRTRLRTLWYRLDEDDRDWITLLHHLVASGREHDPSFAPRTAAMLSDTGVAGPSREAVLDTYLRELPAVAEHGAVLILDDFHLVDDAPDARLIVRELVVRAPERVSVVIASRRTPTIPIAKLRAAGEVVELRTDDLRFDAGETARLFSETYGRTLEPDVLADLSARTEGWAASLQLVQAALRDRSPMEIRRFVRNLTGADQELYDYLAEEVVGELPEDVQQFLMRTSILQVVTPDLAQAVTGLSPADVRRLTATAERFSLLSRRGTQQRDHLRYHPLVRDFLEARLERTLEGRNGVMALHRKVAEAAEGHDWRLACHHYAQVGDEEGIIRTIDDAVEEILARGDVLVAEGYLAGLHEQEAITSHEVIRSRSELKRGDHQLALQRARAARRSDPESVVAALNMALVAYHIGDYELTETVARDVLNMSAGPTQQAMAAGLLSMIEASVDGDLNASLAALEKLRAMQQARGYVHHEAITLLNIAVYQKVKGNPEAVLTACDEAIPRLTDDPDGAVLACVMTARGWAQAALGDLDAARLSFSRAIADVNDAGKPEAMLEAAETEIWLGSSDRAKEYVRDSEPLLKLNPGIADLFIANQAQLTIQSEDPTDSSWIDRFRIGERSLLVGNKSHQLAVVANHAVSNRTAAAEAAVQFALGQAQRQSAGLWIDYCRLLLAILHGPDSLKGELRRLARARPYVISMLTEHVVNNLSVLGEDGEDVLLPEMRRRPERWLPSLRQALDQGTTASLASSRFLEAIGTAEDVGRLRHAGRKHKSAIASDLGKRLARRVAHRVHVEDQGRVALRVGNHHVEGATVRRKVLALLCYLLTRPRFAANRDEVLDALWPDFEPAVALNSLNQTLYFLRRVVEPGYREDTSPEYVRHDSDVVWLDRQLVSSRSQVCADFIRSLPAQPSPEQVQKLAEMYHGQFALDFAYEEWAVGYRESTHASYLQVIENALALDIATGHFDRGVLLARRALNVDPDAEQIELSLVRLLRMSGAHAAAAEQYAHYSSVLETLGLEAPPLDAL